MQPLQNLPFCSSIEYCLAVCGNTKVFIKISLLSYANNTCSGSRNYCTHRQIPETSLTLLDDLKRLHHTFIASRLVSHPNCFAIPAGDLTCLPPRSAPPLPRLWRPIPGGVPGAWQQRLLHQNGNVLVDKLIAADLKQPLPVTSTALQRKSHLCIPVLGIARP
jgi:hypothetical protein